MTEFGIHTADHHLDAMENPPGQTNDGHQFEFQWPALQNWVQANNWNGGSLPAFAGRYFLDGATNQRHDSNLNPFQQPPFQWGHGEGTLAQAAAETLQRIAPLQAADPDRQAQSGDTGLDFGFADAFALCTRLTGCLVGGELSVSNAVINVFLDVAKPSVLSPDYWAAWANTLDNFTVPGQPAATQPFMPCICCAFDVDPKTNKYVIDPNVTACLNTAQLDHPTLNARCYGFWAKAANPANMNQPLDWTRFPTYSQPLTKTGSNPVWIVIWRYAEQSDPPSAGFAGGNRLSLEATNEADKSSVTLNRMLKIEPFALGTGNTRYLGVDRGAPPFTAADANCLIGQTIQPQQPRIRGAGANRQQFSGPVSFVMRYYTVPGLPKLLGKPEINSLHGSGLRIGVVWEQFGSLAEISTPGIGQTHALTAFNYAFSMQQDPHTPVYFAFEFDPVANRQLAETYFKDLLTGYQTYQQQHQPNPVPYAIGVYGSGRLLRFCYEQGIASFFWETNSTAFTDSATIWLHANVVQIDNIVSYVPCNFQAGNPDTRVDFDASWGDEGAW
jgi:hypothetical protein